MSREASIGYERQEKSRKRFLTECLRRIEAQKQALANPDTLTAAAKLFGINPETVPDEERGRLMKIYFHIKDNEALRDFVFFQKCCP